MYEEIVKDLARDYAVWKRTFSGMWIGIVVDIHPRYRKGFQGIQEEVQAEHSIMRSEGW